MAIERLPSTGDAPRSTGVPESLAAGGDADSAGFPWAGRTFDFHDTAFAGDDGSTPAVWRDAVAEVRVAAGSLAAATAEHTSAGGSAGGARAALADAHRGALRALSGIRVLVPLLTEAGDVGLTPEGRTVEKTQELSIVTVAAPDGRHAMPVFSSVETLRRWNPEARPIPVPGPQAALAAAQEGTELLIIDAASPELEFGVRRTQLQAVALGAESVPPWADPEVARVFDASIAGNPRAVGIELAPGDPEARLVAAETVAALRVVPGLDRASLDALLLSIQQRWAASETIAERVDSLRVAIRTA